MAKAGEHDEVGVKLNAREATDAERGEAVVVLQAAELPLDGDAAAVEAAELGCGFALGLWLAYGVALLT